MNTTVFQTPQQIRGAMQNIASNLNLPGRATKSTRVGEANPDKVADKVPYLEPLEMLMNGLPNPDHIDRACQVNVARAVWGAVEGTGHEAIGRDLFLSWSARWPWGGDVAADEQTYESMRDSKIGWKWLRRFAGQLDASLAARVMLAEAQAVFTAKPLTKKDDKAIARWQSLSAPAKASTTFTLAAVQTPAPDKISPRKWLYSRSVIAGFVSVLVAPGGVGKSALMLAEVLSMVTGKALLGGDKPVRPLCVWMHNAEDPQEEQVRRLAGAQMHYGVKDADVGGRLFMSSGRDLTLKLAQMSNEGPEIVAGVVDMLVENMLSKRIDVLVLDPLGAIHTLPENSNEAINLLLGALREIAERTSSAIILVHHTSKAAASDMGPAGANAARGASAIVDGARVVRQLVRMSDREARQFGVSEDERYGYVRIENGKANLSPAAKAHWVKLASVQLRNGTTEYPNGDSVAVVGDWTPPGPTVGTASDLQRVQAAIDNANTAPRANSQARDWVGYVVADSLSLDIGTPDTKAANRSADQAAAFRAVKDMLRQWCAEGTLSEVVERDSRKGKDIPVIQVGAPAILAEHEANKQETA